MTHFSVWDNSTVGAGNMLFCKALSGGSQAVPSGLVVFEDWVPATAPIPPTPTVPVSIDLNLGSATFAGTATINADGSWDATLKARGTWR